MNVKLHFTECKNKHGETFKIHVKEVEKHLNDETAIIEAQRTIIRHMRQFR